MLLGSIVMLTHLLLQTTIMFVADSDDNNAPLISAIFQLHIIVTSTSGIRRYRVKEDFKMKASFSAAATISKASVAHFDGRSWEDAIGHYVFADCF